jgi:hypothetical protein
LEEVRLLSGVETTKDKVLRIILAGQPELNDKMNSPSMVQLAQRVRLRFHLTALSKTDTALYVQHRLEVAGSQGRQIFEPDTFGLIYRYTGGVPRLINTICDTAMLAAFARDSDVVTVEEVKTAVEELQWHEFTERSANNASPPIPRPLPRDRRAALARVMIAVDGNTSDERELVPGRFIIGRTPDNDLQIDSKYVSRHHCQIITSLHASVVEDLNSTNGIYVRGKRVRRTLLNDGDVIQIGQHEILYFDERMARTRNGHDEDDAVPMPDDGTHADQAHIEEATHAEESAQPLVRL